MATVEQQKALVQTLDPDLAGLLQTKDVSLKVQALVAQKKVKTISRLSAMADDRKGIREFCVKTLGLEASVGDDLVEIASVVDAWESARSRVDARNKAEGEAVVDGLPKVVARTELAQLRDRFETAFYPLTEKFMPANATLEQVFDMVDNGEFVNMSLSEFASKENAAQEPVAAVIDRSTGAIKVKKGHIQVPMPTNAEELRVRLRVVAHSFVLSSLRYPHVAVLKGIAPSHFHNYADYLLGDFVLGLHARDSTGGIVSSPSFDLVVAYEYQLRKHVTKLLNAGQTLVAALETSMADPVLKERYFVTPSAFRLAELATVGNSRRERSRSRRVRRDLGLTRAFGKGQSKGKFAALKRLTEDGQQICFAFNNPHEKCRGKCGRAHVCQLCLGKHPMHACKSSLPDARQDDKREE
ncbi:unnamed protein product [Symbiodinium natans]|uniref:Uncharacterized protein n=1 Tax=Symbiodinium natans TaxID=878477 RepID=A0A812JYW3_9DINO|nr:unnamed protein product [Symbiodinium natans]